MAIVITISDACVWSEFGNFDQLKAFVYIDSSLIFFQTEPDSIHNARNLFIAIPSLYNKTFF